MPTPPRPPAGVVRVAFSGSYDTAKWANVMHLNVVPSGQLTQAICDDLLFHTHTMYATHFIPLLATNLTLLESNAVMFAGGNTVFESAVTSPATGQDSGFGLPASIALVVSWRTSNYYRGGHPRTYLCGLVEDRGANTKDWSAQTIADFSAGALAFRDGINGYTPTGVSTVRLGYLQQFANGGSLERPRVYLDPPIFHSFVGAQVHNRMDTQRRRLGREGST